MPEMRLRSGFGRPTPVVFATLITLLAFFVVGAVAVRFSALGESIWSALALNPALVIEEKRVWTLVTYALLHSLGSPMHLVFNGLALYFFGPTMESRWGSRRFAVFMLVSAVVGALFVMATYLVGLGGVPVVGASAITVGLVVAWGFTFPDREVYFFFFPLRGIHLVYVTIAFEVLNALSFSGVSASAHFGGIFVGFLYGDTSPLRRLYLKAKLRRLQAQAASHSGAAPRRRSGGPDLRVVSGGRSDAPPKDKRYLN